MYGDTPGGALTSSFEPAGENDAATAILGNGWRMPESTDFEELLNNEYCSIQWIENYMGSSNGTLITSLINGNTIFIPASGHITGTRVDDIGVQGRYWSTNGGTQRASCIHLDNNPTMSDDYRCLAFCIRAIKV